MGVLAFVVAANSKKVKYALITEQERHVELSWMAHFPTKHLDLRSTALFATGRRDALR